MVKILERRRLFVWECESRKTHSECSRAAAIYALSLNKIKKWTKMRILASYCPLRPVLNIGIFYREYTRATTLPGNILGHWLLKTELFDLGIRSRIMKPFRPCNPCTNVPMEMEPLSSTAAKYPLVYVCTHTHIHTLSLSLSLSLTHTHTHTHTHSLTHSQIGLERLRSVNSDPPRARWSQARPKRPNILSNET